MRVIYYQICGYFGEIEDANISDERVTAIWDEFVHHDREACTDIRNRLKALVDELIPCIAL